MALKGEKKFKATYTGEVYEKDCGPHIFEDKKDNIYDWLRENALYQVYEGHVVIDENSTCIVTVGSMKPKEYLDDGKAKYTRNVEIKYSPPHLGVPEEIKREFSKMGLEEVLEKEN